MKIEKLLAPLIPTDILCIGLNYREHAKESNSTIPENPMLFIKGQQTRSTIRSIDSDSHRSSQIDYEAELAVVIGKTAKNVSRQQAMSHVYGYTCANDVSSRDWATRKIARRRPIVPRQELRRVLPLGPGS